MGRVRWAGSDGPRAIGRERWAGSDWSGPHHSAFTVSLRHVPEGHTVHRIARQLALDLVGHHLTVSSPQGRFAAGARRLDGQLLVASRAVGKQLFLEFESGDVLRVHLGLYGAWDFFGRLTPLAPGDVARGSMGAPRLRRAVRMGENEREIGTLLDAGAGTTDGAGIGTGADRSTESRPDSAFPPDFPPPPVGQVRVRLASAETVADLRGPSACEVLDPDQTAAAVARLGPDPAAGRWIRLNDGLGTGAGWSAPNDPNDHNDPNDPDCSDDSGGSDDSDGSDGRRDLMIARLTSRSVAVGQLLMDQSVVAGIGNIYRAELLFRARLDPHTPGRQVPREVAGALWDDWSVLLAEGIRTGLIITRDLSPADQAAALTDPTLRNWVYHRTGLPCLISGTPVVVEEMAGRNLYWCPVCQRG